MKTLPIHECFYTWQGEGTHTGRAAFFIRTMGCPVQCPWCDSAGTWHPDYVPAKVQRIPVTELVAAATATNCECVVITGGEPTIHDLSELTQQLHEAQLHVHLETCGAFPIKGAFDWITVSPKWWKLPITGNVARANEVKLIVEDTTTIAKWVETLHPYLDAVPTIWLHPEWSKRNDKAILAAISAYVKQHGGAFRAGLQAHKYYAVDALDERSQQPAPLGGNPDRGY